MILGAEEQIKVGQPEPGQENQLISSTATGHEFEVMFEDDGETGYLYALRNGDELEILDALHIYNVADVQDRETPVTVQVFWDVAQTTAALIIAGYCHALYDFQRQMGFCRNAFPPAKNGQTGSRELTDELVEKYFAA
ncbi:DUF2251 domain-containing protein [Hymenobacter cellulosilyticus]|uniref:DUF2251 domain-containing protein n=1 Tax=Hymenobacter cellulosilyticus TaxID=2932248 RepID=A0A8T9QDD2_9BACT|nr:DUF2251 domain-containing protein [Hymenobacter cellulosilyticus]UOQ73840.1 DUF2251 domain-containing protein [Hymenobacter cellulosilyticus]